MAECTDKNQQRKQWSSEPAFVFSMAAIGQGYLVTYGSYIPRKTHVPPG